MKQIEGMGPPISGREIEQLEVSLGVQLPDDYKSFLLQYNGGNPTPDAIDIPTLDDSPTDVTMLFGIGRDLKVSCISWNAEIVSERCRLHRLVPVGRDSFGGLFCFEVENSRARSVVFVDLNDPHLQLHVVASGFEEFVSMLRPFND